MLARCAAAGAMAAVLGVASSALGAAKLPKPGTAAEVTKLVAASSSIQRLPRNLVPPLSQVSSDSPGTYYGVAGRHCDGVTKCVFANTKAKRTIVLFGDSHAQMWLPALVPVAQSAGYRLSLVWMSGCPAATVSVWDPTTHSVYAACNSWRSAMIAQIHKLGPTLVLLGSRTSDMPGPGNKPTTDAAWKTGLERTIHQLKTPTTRVAVIGDISVFSPIPIPQCLSAYPKAIQQCSVKNPNGKTRQHFAAEMAAASAEGVTYVNTQKWLCTTTCSPVIGTMAAYFDTFHVSSTYAEYLSGVWATALKTLLKT